MMADEDKTPKSVQDLAGVDENEEVLDHAGRPTGEKVVPDYDQDGHLVGWHKEPIKKGDK